jgi:hypothetical protein
MRTAVLLVLLALSACSSKHELTQCSGPFQALLPPSTPAGVDTAAANPPPPTLLGEIR